MKVRKRVGGRKRKGGLVLVCLQCLQLLSILFVIYFMKEEKERWREEEGRRPGARMSAAMTFANN